MGDATDPVNPGSQDGGQGTSQSEGGQQSSQQQQQSSSGGDQTVKLDGSNWGDFLGDLKGDPVFKPYEGKSVEEVFKGYANAAKLIGGDKIVVPAGNLNTKENWDQVWDKLGRPKDHTGYKFALEAGILPKGAKLDPKLDEAYAKACHTLGILPQQAQGFTNGMRNC